MLNIAVNGTGNVGGALGRVWAKKGHSLLFGAPLLEPLAMLWINLAVFGGMGTGFAFKLMKR